MKRTVILLSVLAVILTVLVSTVDAQEWTFNSSPLSTIDVPLAVAPQWPEEAYRIMLHVLNRFSLTEQ